MSKIKEKLKKFWLTYEVKIILVIGIILIAGVAFESGYLKGKTGQDSPIIIEKTIQAQNSSPKGTSGSSARAQNTTQEAKIIYPPQNPSTTFGASCAYVGSKNSNKYHIPSSRCAKQIKPENIVCFSSAEDATAKGYQSGCLK